MMTLNTYRATVVDFFGGKAAVRIQLKSGSVLFVVVFKLLANGCQIFCITTVTDANCQADYR